MRISHLLRFGVIIFCIILLLSTTHLPRANAAFRTVTSLADSGAGSLRDTIASAIAGDTIFFGVTGTITLLSQITIDRNLIIVSNDHIAISGNNVTRLFSVNAGVTTTLSHLRLINGNAGGADGGAVLNSGTLTVTYVTFSTNSAANGGAISSLGALTIGNSAFTTNTATSSGGAINLNSGDTLTITDSTFSNNSANAGGGAIRSDGALNLTRSTFSNNTNIGSGGGAGGAVYSISGALAVINSTFFNNSSQVLTGGAIHASNPTNIDSSTFSNNSAPDGGAVSIGSTTTTISRSIISNGSCSIDGGTLVNGGNNIAFNATGCAGANVDPMLGTFANYGGITQTIPLLSGSPAANAYTTNCPAVDQRGVARPVGASCDIGAYEGQYTVHTVTNLNNTGAGSLRTTIAGAAAGDKIVFGVSGTIVLANQIDISRHLTIDGSGQSIILDGNNTVGVLGIIVDTTVELHNFSVRNGRGAGSGAIINRGTLTIRNLNIANSTASDSGGAIYNHGTLTINNSAFVSNVGTLNGGAIYNGGILVINNSTFANNSAANNGGAIDDGGVSAPITITNSTFFNNTATNGGSFRRSASFPTISRSIFVSGSCTGTIVDGGNNIAFNATGCPGANVDPMLGTLSENDGATQVIPLLEGSPAIDAYSTNCPSTDQRGISRPFGAACDIGAYEWRSPLTVTNLNDSGAGSLRSIITTAISGDTVNFSVSGTITLTSGQIVIDKNLTIDGGGENITLNGNNASRIFQVDANATVELRNLTFTNASPGAQGGAILNNGELVIRDATFSGNTGSAGGAIFNDGRMTIYDSNFSNNSATNANMGGGAIYNNSGLSFILTSNFTNNQTTGSGGAIGGGATISINISTLSGNTAAKFGGGVISLTGDLIIDATTISGNTATNNDGGGVYNTAALNMTNSTLTGNHAGGNGGALVTGTNTTLDSITITDNTATTGANIYILANTTLVSRTILSEGSCTLAPGASFLVGDDNIAFNATGCPGTIVDPLLGTLGNYGGATQTIPLLLGSPAIDVYSNACLTMDQRRIARPQGAACDVGAFEVEPISTSTTINENEFFAALESARASYPDITQIIVDFIPGTMNLTVITSSGTVGSVQVTVTQADGFVTINIASVTVNGAPAPNSYLTIINRDLPNIIISALDSLVIERFGSLTDIDTLSINGNALTITRTP